MQSFHEERQSLMVKLDHLTKDVQLKEQSLFATQQRVDSLKATLKRNQDKHDEWKEESSVETTHL